MSHTCEPNGKQEKILKVIPLSCINTETIGEVISSILSCSTLSEHLIPQRVESITTTKEIHTHVHTLMYLQGLSLSFSHTYVKEVRRSTREPSDTKLLN